MTRPSPDTQPARTKEVKIEVDLDGQNIPSAIRWNATDLQGFERAECRAMFLSLWDHRSKDTLKLDLWTRHMTVDEMKIFFHQTLVSMANSLENAIQDKAVAGDMRDFCDYLAEKLDIAAGE